MSRKRTLITLPEKALNDQSLNLTEIRVLGALEFFCDHSTGISTPPGGAITSLLGVRIEQVSRASKKLESAGWIEKTGKACRSNPAKYRLNWLIKDDSNDHQKVASEGNQSTRERLTQKATNHLAKVDSEGNQSPRKVDSEGNQYAYQRVYTCARSNLLITNTDTNTNQDQCDEVEAVNSEFGLTDAFGLLVTHGTPKQFLTTKEDEQIVTSWLQAGVDAVWLTRVCAEAVKRKIRADKNRGVEYTPPGPSYIDKVMTSMTEEVKRAAGDSIATTNYRQEW